MQKYAILEEKTNMLLAWYSEEMQGILVPEQTDDDGKVIREKYYDTSNFPKPYIKVDDVMYNEALSKGFNYYNSKTKKFELKDFRTENQIEEENLKTKKNEANRYLKDTDWVKDYKLRHDLGLEVIPSDSNKWEIIKQREIYLEFLKTL